MRRFHLGLALVALPVFAFSLFVAGCNKEETKKTDSGKDSGKQVETPKELKPIAAGKGHLKGKITLKGAAPDIETATKDLLAQINAKDDKATCLKGSPSEVTEQTYRLGGPDNKQVGNVFVWIMPETGTYFQISEEQVSAANKRKVAFDQPHCAFIPHCNLLFPSYVADPKKPKDLKPTGQFLEIKNSSPIAHNTKWDGPRNKSGNETIKPGGHIEVKELRPATGPISLKCNVHGWMDAYLWVFDHPYATISLSDTLDGDNKVKADDAKFGTYELKGLPVAKVKIAAWHEKAGFLNKSGGKGDPIEIKADGPTVLDFELKPPE
jgi:hypothetical protein